MADGDNPAAAVLEALTTAPETPADTPAQVPAPKSDEPKQSEAPTAPPEPDIDALLARDDVLERLRKHPIVQADIEHRSKSIRDADVERRVQEGIRRANAEAKQQAEAMLQVAKEEQDDAEAWRRVNEDPDSPASQWLKPQLEARRAARDAARSEQQVTEKLWPQFQQQAEVAANQRLMSMVLDFVDKHPHLSDEDKAALDPRRYTDHLSFLSGVFDTLSTKQAKELAKTLVKPEAEAMVQERLAALRAEEKSPVTLPPGSSGETDESFSAAYAGGKSNNTARQLQWMHENGIL